MYKKIIVLFLLLGTSMIVLPGESKAAVKGETTIVESTLVPGAALVAQRYRRRWRKRRQMRRNYRWYRWNNRRDRRRDRRENRRERRRDRRDRRY